MFDLIREIDKNSSMTTTDEDITRSRGMMSPMNNRGEGDTDMNATIVEQWRHSVGDWPEHEYDCDRNEASEMKMTRRT